MTDHSPRPWQWAPKSGVDSPAVLWAGYDMIVLASIAKPEPADACLIATAPDLLRACEAHGEVADHRGTCQKCGPEYYCWTALALLECAWQMTEPAIAKAKGE